MTNKNREAIIKKIAKCMALSKSSNSNEAAIALRQAEKLMVQYGITEKEITLTNVKEPAFKVQKSLKRPPAWLIDLGSVCAEAFSCEMYYTKQWSDDNYYNVFVFIGVKEYPDLAKYCYDVLLRQLNDISELYRQSFKLKGTSCGLQRLNSFRCGWIYEVSKKLEQLRREDDQQPKSNTVKNMPILIKNTVNLYMEENHPNLKVFKSRSETDPLAFAHGMLRGAKANLNHAINDNHDSKKLID